MSKVFFFGTIVILICLMIWVNKNHKLNLRSGIIGISSMAYSLMYESFFGTYMNLYYYIDKGHSILFIIISGIFIYPALNILYIIFLPCERKRILAYTTVWVIGMLFFEYVSVLTGTIVFTGWKPVPWSIITYIITYVWVYYFNKLLAHNMK